ncbi:MAG: hypothetical protein Q9M94_05250 [Candidatus Gracilibacteria bacterium]|nr:hypothetical protein [Candidatus Gracilibacteria bacterium]MDQ7023450.1 hypothetical protein [Candidatus Gracilibacteria bacterium]
MNFQTLKGMVDSLVQTFSCPECNSGVDENCVDVMGTAGQNINVDVICPHCHKHSIIRAQILALEIPIQDIKIESNTKKKILIKDSQIIELNKNLKSNNISISELFGE